MSRLLSPCNGLRLTLIVAQITCALMCCCRSHGYAQDLSAFDAPAPVTSQPIPDLSAFDIVAPAAASPIDLSAFDPAPVKKPTVKPSRSALEKLTRSVELGNEVSGMAKPMAAVTAKEFEFDYPLRSSNWTYPGSTREDLIRHLLDAEHHRGKFTLHVLNRLSTNELKALHSDDHERPLSISERAAPPMQVAEVPHSWGNVSSFQWLSDGRYHPTPEPGTRYPSLGGILVPLSSSTCTTPRATPGTNTISARYSSPVQSFPVYQQQSGCPGGVCPVPQSKGKKKFLGLF